MLPMIANFLATSQHSLIMTSDYGSFCLPGSMKKVFKSVTNACDDSRKVISFVAAVILTMTTITFEARAFMPMRVRGGIQNQF